MTTNAVGISTIQELVRLGQSLWLDNLQRKLITSGELARLRDAGITGITSNPTIFEKAISNSSDYEADLRQLAKAGHSPEQIMWELMIGDVQAAADIFRPVYEGSGGADGFVSIEVGPAIARDTSRTIEMAEELHRRCARPNVMVKIPATHAGLAAIQHMIGEGKHTNVTLTFSIGRYSEVVEAYLSGLEDLQKRGGDLSRVVSVASFFVSRVDTKVDKLLNARIDATSDARVKREIEELCGRTGIANSKMAYRRYQELFSGPRWEALQRAGARVQRCLWASTSTKDPRYRDTMYVEGLIGPDTVNTVPDAALRDHGKVRPTLLEDLSAARRQLQRLPDLEIDLDQVTQELETEGVQGFVNSYESLLEVIKDAVRIHGARC
jgi:transaldolase